MSSLVIVHHVVRILCKGFSVKEGETFPGKCVLRSDSGNAYTLKLSKVIEAVAGTGMMSPNSVALGIASSMFDWADAFNEACRAVQFPHFD